jgi:hemerythrin-like domain-containing protein
MKLICTPTFVLLYSNDQCVELRSVDVLDQMAKLVENHQMPDAKDVETILRFLYTLADDHLQQFLFDSGRERSLVEAIENSFQRRQDPEFAGLARQLIELMRDEARAEDTKLFEVAEGLLSKAQNENVVAESHASRIDDTRLSDLRSLEGKYLKKASA